MNWILKIVGIRVANTHFFHLPEKGASALYSVSSARVSWIKDVESKNCIANDYLKKKIDLWASLILNDISSNQPLQNVATVGSTQSLLELNKTFTYPLRRPEDSSAVTKHTSQTIQQSELTPQLISEWIIWFKSRVEMQLNCYMCMTYRTVSSTQR